MNIPNAINYLINKIKLEIPNEVLNIAFTDDTVEPLYNNYSIDERILQMYLIPHLLTDLNLASQNTFTARLLDLELLEQGVDYRIYKIPLTLTNNNIVVSVSYITTGYGATHSAANNLQRDIQVGMDSNTRADVYTNSNISLIGENTFLLRNVAYTVGNEAIKITATNDAMLNNIQPKTYFSLKGLAVQGCKAFIYNTLRVKVDKGYIFNGYNLETINSIISEYSSAQEEYDRIYEEETKAILYMDNDKSMTDFITDMFSYNI